METGKNKILIDISKGFQKGVIKGYQITYGNTIILNDETTKLYLITVLKDIGLNKVNNIIQTFIYNSTKYNIYNINKTLIEIKTYFMKPLIKFPVQLIGTKTSDFEFINGKYIKVSTIINNVNNIFS